MKGEKGKKGKRNGERKTKLGRKGKGEMVPHFLVQSDASVSVSQ